MSYLFTKSVAAGIITSLIIGIGIALDPPDRIELDPETTDRFVLDPAEFDPDDENAQILRHENFGRKDPAVYKRVQREDGDYVIEATSENAISSVTTSLKADPNIFQYLEWEWKIDDGVFHPSVFRT